MSDPNGNSESKSDPEIESEPEREMRTDPGPPETGDTGDADPRFSRLTADLSDRGQGAVLTTGDTTVIARTVARVVAPLVLLTSISLLFQGHNLPGGGFIGGVLTATGIALLYIIYGLDYIQDTLVGVVGDDGTETVDRGGTSNSARWVFGIGLAVAAGSGLVPILFGYPVFTQAVYIFPHPFPVPLYEEFEVASAFAFDLGVYFTVVGGLLAILREVGKE